MSLLLSVTCAEWCILFIVMLNVIVLNVIVLNVIVLNAILPSEEPKGPCVSRSYGCAPAAVDSKL